VTTVGASPPVCGIIGEVIDPGEQTSLADEQQELVARMKALLPD